MSELKTTPGPWHYRPDEYDDWGIVKAGNFAICQVRDPSALEDDILNQHRRAGTDPWEANARLIAAAPDLYEALMDARCILNVTLSHGDESALKLLRKVDVALSLALGEKTETPS